MAGQLLSGDATGVQVDWRERVTVHYRLIPMERESSTCLLSECSFAKDTTTLVEGALSPTSTDYLCLEKACAEFEVCFLFHLLVSSSSCCCLVGFLNWFVINALRLIRVLGINTNLICYEHNRRRTGKSSIHSPLHKFGRPTLARHHSRRGKLQVMGWKKLTLAQRTPHPYRNFFLPIEAIQI